MPSGRSAFLNSSSMLGGQFASKGALLVSMVILSHYMGDAEFGLLSLAVALGQVLYIASDMGVSMVLNRRLSLGEALPRDLLPAASAARLALSAVWLLLLASAALMIDPRPQTVGMMMLVGLGSCLDSHAELAFSVFRSAERMGGEGLSRTVAGLSGVGLVVAVVLLDLGPVAVAATYAARSVAGLLASGLLLRRFGASLLPGLDIRASGRLLAGGWQIGLMMLAMVGWQRLDNVILSLRLGPESVAAWQECYRLLDSMVLLISPTLLPGALFPGLCRAHGRSRECFERYMTGLAQVATGLGLLTTVLMLSGGRDLLRLLWGSGYLRGFGAEEVTTCFVLVAASAPVVFWMNMLVASMIAAGRNREVLLYSSVAIVLSVSLNLILLESAGLVAPALALIASNLLLSALFHRSLGDGRFLRIFGMTWKALLPLVPAAAALTLAEGLPVLPRTAAATSAYLAGWALLGGLKPVLERGSPES